MSVISLDYLHRLTLKHCRFSSSVGILSATVKYSTVDVINVIPLDSEATITPGM